MPEQPENVAQGLERISERLEELERRVGTLEKQGESPTNAPVKAYAGVIPKEKEKRTGSTSVGPVLGKAVLGIAGAYLLRAIAESGAASLRMMLVAGIAYAAVWLVWAVRSHQRSHFASVIFGLTAAVILPPLLWEGTVRFHELPVSLTSAVLAGAVLLCLGLAWKERLEAIPWIGTLVAVMTVFALIIATHELRPLTTTLLALALVTEAVAASGRWPGLRVVTAVAADYAVCLVGVVMTSEDGVPESYRAMGAAELNAYCAALMIIYGASIGVRAFVMRRRLTLSEVMQAVVAFLLGTWVSLRATHGGSASVLGAVFLLLAMVCYWGALKRFAGAEERRNRRVCANFAAGLVLAASLLLLKGNLQALALSVAAVAAVAVFTRTKYLSLGIHGTFYLLVAGMECGLFSYTASVLAGRVPVWPEWSFWAVSLAGLLSYVLGSRASGEGWRERMLWVVPAAVVGSAVAALIVAGIAGLGAGELNASRLSMVRTGVTCVIALGLGYAGSRWNRVELGWVAYGAIGLGALKLIVEDLRFGSAGTLMVSLLFYGLILILLPRVTRFGRIEV
ncbi:MAG: hypothetical protein WBQ89_18595 [Candidatus Acidiferrum sp.]